MRPLRVIAGAVVAGGRLLLVSKRAAPAVWFLPGGKPEPGEAALACLRRELGEELGVRLTRARHFAEVRSRAALEGVDMHMSVFVVELAGVPAPAAEIAGLAWWPAPRELQLAPAVRDHVIPALHDAGALRAPPAVLRRGSRAAAAPSRPGARARAGERRPAP